MKNEVIIANHEVPPRVKSAQHFRRVFFSRGVVIFGMIIIVALIITAIFAPLLAPYNPNKVDYSNVLQSSSKAHWLGTDSLGRDTLSRIIYGTRTSLEVGLLVVFFASLTGIILGILAGYYGGWVHIIIMRFIDALMSFPMILLAMVIAALLGSGMKNVIIALSISLMPGYCRLMCGQVLSVKENDYILASRAGGANDAWIMTRHIFPNCLPPVIVLMTMMLGATILAEASLSFLGIGILPPTPAWGSMVYDGRGFLKQLPILSLAPGAAVMLTVFSMNMVGDGLRDALDPRLRGIL